MVVDGFDTTWKLPTVEAQPKQPRALTAKPLGSTKPRDSTEEEKKRVSKDLMIRGLGQGLDH